MAGIDTVQLNITLDALAVSQVGLGTPLIAGTSTVLAENEVAEYGSLTEATDAGFSTSDYEYKALEAMFAQIPRPSTAKVTRLGASVAQVSDVLIGGAVDGDYTITINGIDYKFVAAGSTVSLIVAGLVALINPAAAPVVAGDADPNVTLTATNPGEPFTVSVATTGSAMTLTAPQPNVGVLEELGESAANDPDWYGLVIESRDSWDILEAARFAESNRKLYGAQSNDAGIPVAATTDDVASQLMDLSRFRSFVLFYADDADPAVEAWMGKTISVNPDEATTIWAHKTLVGITPDDLTIAQQNAIEGKNASHYGTLGGVGATFFGTLADGRFIDQAVTVDWLYFRLLADIQQLFLDYSNRGSKIPYTDAGIQIFGAATRTRLQIGANLDHLAGDPAPRVTMPARADVPDADVLARVLRWTFEAQFAGAIQKAIISGAVVTTLPA
jgi:hypothetical protein